MNLCKATYVLLENQNCGLGRREILTHQFVLSGNGYENMGWGRELVLPALDRKSCKDKVVRQKKT